MATLTPAEIVNEIILELGNPDPNTELSTDTALAQWNRALEIFNLKVGKIVLEDLDVTSGVQNYDLDTIYAAHAIKKVKNVFFTRSSISNTAINFDIDGLNSDNTFVYYDEAEIAIAATLNKINASVFEKDWRVIEGDSNTLVILPCPETTETLKILMQTAYDSTTLPDKYEPIVRLKAKALCADVIANSRSRLATPMRSGDFVRYAAREKTVYQYSDKLHIKFEEECEQINRRRIF